MPEGFYSIARRQMNPNSHYYLSFDIGFPNVYDKAHGASGGYLMVHGTCSSAGCYAMTDKQIGEIYAIAREAFAGGQQAFQFQAFPFRVSAQNMARYRLDKNIDFWRLLPGHSGGGPRRSRRSAKFLSELDRSDLRPRLREARLAFGGIVVISKLELRSTPGWIVSQFKIERPDGQADHLI